MSRQEKRPTLPLHLDLLQVLCGMLNTPLVFARHPIYSALISFLTLGGFGFAIWVKMSSGLAKANTMMLWTIAIMGIYCFFMSLSVRALALRSQWWWGKKVVAEIENWERANTEKCLRAGS